MHQSFAQLTDLLSCRLIHLVQLVVILLEAHMAYHNRSVIVFLLKNGAMTTLSGGKSTTQQQLTLTLVAGLNREQGTAAAVMQHM